MKREKNNTHNQWVSARAHLLILTTHVTSGNDVWNNAFNHVACNITNAVMLFLLLLSFVHPCTTFSILDQTHKLRSFCTTSHTHSLRPFIHKLLCFALVKFLKWLFECDHIWHMMMMMMMMRCTEQIIFITFIAFSSIPLTHDNYDYHQFYGLEN